jgi:hypothetical protein
MPADALLDHLVWILPASITLAIGIVTIMGLFGGNQMPVEGKVSILSLPLHTLSKKDEKRCC